jgi:hypothetical protein
VLVFRPSGRLFRVVSLAGVTPLAAALDATGSGDRMIVMCAGRESLLAVRLAADPPQAGPVEAVRGFLGALAARDLRLASSWVALERADRLLRLEEAPEALPDLADAAARIEDLRCVRLEDSSSSVVGALPDGSQTTGVEFILRRDEERNWKLWQY